MREFRIAAAVMCLLALCFGAAAEEPPGQAVPVPGGGWRLEMTCDAETLPALTGDALAAAQTGLAGLGLRLTAGEDHSRLTVTGPAGETLLDICVLEQTGGELIYFPQTGHAYEADANALSRWTGASGEVPEAYRLPSLYPAAAAPAFAVLEQAATGKAVTKSTAVKNAAAAPSGAKYTLTAEEMTALWPSLWAALRPAADEAIGSSAWAAMERLSFTGDWSVQRLLDAAGRDMGVLASGKAGLLEDQRKVTLKYGFTEGKGGSFSLSAPAVKGKNTLKIVCNVKITEKNGKSAYTLDGSYTRRQNGETVSAEGEGKLQGAAVPEGMQWTGSVTLNLNAGEKATYTLRPTLTRDESGLRGEMSVRKKQGKQETLDVTLHLSLAAETEAMPPVPGDAVPWTEDTFLAAEGQGLYRALVRWIGALPTETRTRLTFQLHGDEWLTRRQSVPLTEIAFENTPDDDWPVEEE